MSFKERFTTEGVKSEVSNDKDKTAEEKEKENGKIVVSNEAYLNAEMMENLTKEINFLRVKLGR